MTRRFKILGRRNERRLQYTSRAPHRRSTPSIRPGWLRLLSREPTPFGCLGWIEGIEFVCVKVDPALYSQIIRDKSLSDGAFRLWHLLRDMTGANNCCWPSVRTVSELLGCNKNSVLARIIELESNGYLRIERGNRHKSNRYFVGGTAFKTGGTPAKTIGGTRTGTELNSQIQSIPVSRPSSPTEPEMNPTQAAALFRQMRESL